MFIIKEQAKVLIINPDEISAYSPEDHKEASYRCLIGPEQGVSHIGVIIGSCSRSSKSEWHKHTYDQIVYLLKGKASTNTKETVFSINVGEMIYIPAGIDHQALVESEITQYLIINVMPDSSVKKGKYDPQVIVINPDEVPVYVPQGHADTFNRLLLGLEQGCTGVEIILGKFGKQGAAHPHAHSYVQMVYMLEGVNRNISNGIEQITRPGQLKFIPGDVEHQSYTETDHTKFLLLYAPPRSSIKL